MGNITKKIYIVHGWTYTLDAWNACIDGLKTAGFEPVMLRVPGLTSPSEKVWTLDEYVAWLDAALPNESDVSSGVAEPIMLIAHSNGGRIAIALAAKKPNRIAELVLMDAAGIVHNEMPLRLKRAVFGTLAKAGRKFTSRVFLRKLFHKIILAHDYARAPENMRETMKNLITVDLTDRLSSITAKTLILWGNHDKATPVMDAHTMHHRISGSKLVVFEGIGHSPHKDVPQKVVGEICNWHGAQNRQNGAK